MPRSAPTPPPGEAALRGLAQRFVKTEAQIAAWVAEAAVGDRRLWARRAQELLVELRRLDFARPVHLAYRYMHPEGMPETAVRDLAGALALRLDSGAQTAADGARDAFKRVTRENLSELAVEPLTAAVDRQGARWGLGRWAELNCETYGRHATSRGVADRVGDGNTVTVIATGCAWCRQHEGAATVGEDPLPPFHPGCQCVATT